MRKPAPHGLTAEQRVRLEIPILGATDDELVAELALARADPSPADPDFAQVERYCMFIGYPRSGHSLVGSLIDAHPDALIAHELNALRYVAAGAGRLDLFRLLARNSGEFTALGRRWGDYSYAVPGQWQGRWRRLRVIGDKKGGSSSGILAERPDLLDRLRATVGVPLRLVHVVRNPYDNIATIARKDTGDLAQAIRFYFRLIETNARIAAGAPDDVLTLRHEGVIDAPRQALRLLAAFLDLDPAGDWLVACAGIVAPAPRLTRHDLEWPAAARAAVARGIAASPLLAGYDFDR